MSKAKYVAIYPDNTGKLQIIEDVTVEELKSIYKHLTVNSQTQGILVFNMSGIVTANEVKGSPKGGYTLVYIEKGELRILDVASVPDFTELINAVEQYYLIDDIYIINELALKQLLD